MSARPIEERLCDILGVHAPLQLPPRDPVAQRVPAAVLVPLKLAPEPRIVLTVRSRFLREHAGEVCFPGGKPSAGDADLWATAVREAREEIALDPRHLRCLGALTPMPTATSRFRLHPFVARVSADHEPFRLSAEVSEVLELPLSGFADGRFRFRVFPFEWAGVQVHTPCFELDGAHRLIGASAYVFVELLLVVGHVFGLSLPVPELGTRPF